MTLLPLLLLAPLVGGAVYALAQHGERRQANRHVPEFERFAVDIQNLGFWPAFRSWHTLFLAQRLPLDQAAAATSEEADRLEGRFAQHGRPVLAKHPNLVPHVVLMSALAVVGALMFVVHVQLETGLVKTLLSNDAAKAWLLGIIVAVSTTLLGGAVMEFLVPSDGLHQLKEMPRPRRLGWLAGLGAAFVVTLALLPQLAMARADTLYGDKLAKEEAVCEQVSADAASPPAAKAVACSTARATAQQHDRARTWDAVVSVAAPLGEAVGVWGLLALVGLGVPAMMGRGATRARRCARTAADRVAQADADFQVQVRQAAARAGVSADELDGGEEGAVLEAPRGDNGAAAEVDDEVVEPELIDQGLIDQGLVDNGVRIDTEVIETQARPADGAVARPSRTNFGDPNPPVDDAPADFDRFAF